MGWWEAQQFGNYTISAHMYFLITHWLQLNEYFLLLFAFNKNSKGSIYEVRRTKPKLQILFHMTQYAKQWSEDIFESSFFLLTLCTSCTWLPLLGVLLRQRSGFSVALPWWGSVAAMGYRWLPCTNKGLLQFKADPAMALGGSCPYLRITDKKGGSEESGSSRHQSGA